MKVRKWKRNNFKKIEFPYTMTFSEKKIESEKEKEKSN